MHLESFITSVLNSSSIAPAVPNCAPQPAIDLPSSRLTTMNPLTPFLSSKIKARQPHYEAPKALRHQLWTPLLPILDKFKSPSPPNALDVRYHNLRSLLQGAKPRPRLSAFEPLQNLILRHLLAPGAFQRPRRLPGPRSWPSQLVVRSTRIRGREWRRFKRSFLRTLRRTLVWMGVPEVIMIVGLRVEMDIPILPWVVRVLLLWSWERGAADTGAGDRMWEFILPARVWFFFLAMAVEGAEAGGLVWIW
ncbi:hypothetical protein H2199_008890 [Coniosporium tulheliwenetii]|uniref:Uncharacterized protein n=1 Tax=Coniosporium tulheliwenetii TaxID=3383036 RepID=A0ACC2YH82_9PEZI|nr:hypothetical protein H2199_008890 [Cladosporium sp. JES 115]